MKREEKEKLAREEEEARFGSILLSLSLSLSLAEESKGCFKQSPMESKELPLKETQRILFKVPFTTWVSIFTTTTCVYSPPPLVRERESRRDERERDCFASFICLNLSILLLPLFLCRMSSSLLLDFHLSWLECHEASFLSCHCLQGLKKGMREGMSWTGNDDDRSRTGRKEEGGMSEQSEKRPESTPGIIWGKNNMFHERRQDFSLDSSLDSPQVF